MNHFQQGGAHLSEQLLCGRCGEKEKCSFDSGGLEQLMSLHVLPVTLCLCIDWFWWNRIEFWGGKWVQLESEIMHAEENNFWSLLLRMNTTEATKMEATVQHCVVVYSVSDETDSLKTLWNCVKLRGQCTAPEENTSKVRINLHQIDNTANTTCVNTESFWK